MSEENKLRKKQYGKHTEKKNSRWEKNKTNERCGAVMMFFKITNFVGFL